MGTHENTVEEIMTLLAGSASEAYYGEPVTQLEHGLQAAQLARDADADEETILAALLHDVGHLLGHEGRIHEKLGVIDHDEAGAQWLRARGFSERLTALVRAHVDAKRYLVATNAGYAARLSPASTETLALQGGPMSPEEAQAFGADPMLKEKLRMRSWDEQAKIPGAAAAPLAEYRAMLLRHLQRG